MSHRQSLQRASSDGSEPPNATSFGSLSSMVGLGSLPLFGKRRGSTSQERWVCPNDRQLALRAKLQMGWSTGQTTPTKPTALSETETKTIMDVIKKAEEIELGEQTRVGRLVQKVENMKRKRLGNGVSTCILCGTNLPILRTSSLVCSDCEKGVCPRCGVELHPPGKDPIWLCKICSETREMWKRSGAWFFHGLPKHILPSNTADTKRLRPPPKRRNTTVGKGSDEQDQSPAEDDQCRRLRITKPSTERISDLPDTAHLCLSPRPKLPGMPPVTPDPSAFSLLSRSRSVSPSPLRIDLTCAKGGLEPGYGDRSPISPGLFPRDLTRTPSRESTVETGVLLTPRYTPSPSSLSPRNELRRDHAFDRSPSPLLRVAWRESGRSSNSSVSDTSLSISKDEADCDLDSKKDVHASHAATAPINISSVPPTNSSHSSSSGVAGSASPVVNGFRSRRGSEASKSSQEDKKSLKSAKLSELRGSLESISKDSTKENCLNESSSDDVFPESMSDGGSSYNDIRSGLGMLEFSLMYDSHTQSLHCTIHSAKDLKPGLEENNIDPYVKLHLLPGASKSNKLRTKTITKCLNPQFNETLTYYGISDEDMAKKTLRFMVLNEDRFKNEFLGEIRMPLKTLIPHETKKFKQNLEKRTNRTDDEAKQSDLGKILLSLKYSTQRSVLIIGIVRCAHLPSMDPNGFSDPYVKILIRHNNVVVKKFKTGVKWKNLNPEFNEEFIYDIKKNELAGKTLEIHVYDKDVGRSDDYIGGVTFSQQSGGAPLRHWYDVLRYSDRRHDRWHQLEYVHK